MIATTSPIKMRKQRRVDERRSRADKQDGEILTKQSKKRKESPVHSRKHSKSTTTERHATPPKKSKHMDRISIGGTDIQPFSFPARESSMEDFLFEEDSSIVVKFSSSSPATLKLTRDIVIITNDCFPKLFQMPDKTPRRRIQSEPGMLALPPRITPVLSPRIPRTLSGKRPESIEERQLDYERSAWRKFWSETLALPVRTHLLDSAELVFMPEHTDLFIQNHEEISSSPNEPEEDTWVVFMVSFVPSSLQDDGELLAPTIVLTTPLDKTGSHYLEPLRISADSPLDLILKLGRELSENPQRCPNESQRELIRSTCLERSLTTVWSMFRLLFPSAGRGGINYSDDADHLSLEFSMDNQEETLVAASGPQSAVNLCGGTLEDLRVFFSLVNSNEDKSDLSAAQQINKARAILLMSIDEATRRSATGEEGSTPQLSLSQNEQILGSPPSRVVFNISGTRPFLDQVPENDSGNDLDEDSMDVVYSLVDSGIVSVDSGIVSVDSGVAPWSL
jgi:hypothetical protein